MGTRHPLYLCLAQSTPGTGFPSHGPPPSASHLGTAVRAPCRDKERREGVTAGLQEERLTLLSLCFHQPLFCLFVLHMGSQKGHTCVCIQLNDSSSGAVTTNFLMKQLFIVVSIWLQLDDDKLDKYSSKDYILKSCPLDQREKAMDFQNTQRMIMYLLPHVYSLFMILPLHMGSK